VSQTVFIPGALFYDNLLSCVKCPVIYRALYTSNDEDYILQYSK